MSNISANFSRHLSSLNRFQDEFKDGMDDTSILQLPYGLILDTRPKALPIVLTIEYGPMMNGCRIGFKCLDQWPTSSQWPVAAGHKHSSKDN